MKRDRVEIMLGELGQATGQAVGGDLGDRLKAGIPQELRPHRGGMDSINIIIDLRVSRLAAAAVIVGATLLFATFFGSRDPEAGLYSDSKAIIEYLSRANELSVGAVAAVSAAKDAGTLDDREFVIYGERSGSGDSNDLLMHWKIGEGKYRVMFSDKHTDTVDSEELIRLQAGMIQRITKD
jgi:hypothetical protein